MATWFQGSGDEFIKVSREGFERGVRILHFLGGILIDLAGPRAVSQAKMTISQRAEVKASSAMSCARDASTTSSREGRPLGHRPAPADL